MKPAACDIRHQRSPTVRFDEYWMRSVETHSRTRLAPSNWRFTAGYMSRYLLNSSSGVMSVGFGYTRSSNVRPTLHSGFLESL